ncbi:hypothetical protein ACFS5M_04305 [Lacinutrix iliipiscaria]|uniref:Uncharacterized protein n=1 Tax=Lacinutrix iliipiscaria TaxID=1230532 RepID=A0ABW5WK74_9FLAO
MKKCLILVFLFTITTSSIAQNTFTVNNETLELKTEVEGTLDLLWNTIDGEFRYFVKDDSDAIQELKNTKDSESKTYKEEYKTVLNRLTGNSISTDKVNLTLSSLRQFFDDYNVSKNIDYQVSEKARLESRIGVFGGLTNHPFVENPDNKSTPFFGIEFEILEANKMPRHAGFFSMRHALEHSDYKYSATQLALGYRYRFINQPSFNIYANVKFATYTFSKFLDESESSFDVPFIFGIGSDIKVGKNGFITFAYNELFAVFIDNEGNFPIDFAIGYKMKL